MFTVLVGIIALFGTGYGEENNIKQTLLDQQVVELLIDSDVIILV